MTKCDRCRKQTSATIMSMFNTQILCMERARMRKKKTPATRRRGMPTMPRFGLAITTSAESVGGAATVSAPIAGVWTPWAEVLCRVCHDALPEEVTAKRKIEWPAADTLSASLREKREGDGPGQEIGVPSAARRSGCRKISPSSPGCASW